MVTTHGTTASTAGTAGPASPPTTGADDAELGPAPHRLGHYAWRVWGPLVTGDRELVRGM